MMWATIKGHSSCLERLIYNGANIYAKDEVSGSFKMLLPTIHNLTYYNHQRGRTALMYAGIEDHVPCMDLLIRSRADQEACDNVSNFMFIPLCVSIEVMHVYFAVTL